MTEETRGMAAARRQWVLEERKDKGGVGGWRADAVEHRRQSVSKKDSKEEKNRWTDERTGLSHSV